MELLLSEDVDCLSFNADDHILAAGSRNGDVFLVDVLTNQTVAHIRPGGEKPVGAVNFHPNSPHSLFTASGRDILHIDIRMLTETSDSTSPTPMHK